MNCFKSLIRRESAKTVGRRTRSARVGVEAVESKLLLSAGATPSYALYSNGQLYEQMAGQTFLLASNVKSAAVTSTNAVVYLEQNGTLIDQPASGSAQVIDRLDYSFQLGSGNQIYVVDWFDSNLSNAGICNVTRGDFTRDGAITRNDMLGIFNTVLQAGPVTNAEARDLQTLVANATTLNIPGYVQNLANKVVNPSYSDTSYLRQYYSNAPTMPLLQGLVNQWFLGTVEPNAVDADEPGPNNTLIAYDPNNTYTAVGATGYTLFGPNGPSFTDVAQGSAGDCWLLAALAETAALKPSIINNMFINNGDGTWTVRLYVNGAPDYVTVNDQLPTGPFNGYAFDQPQNGALWVALAEKAYAQENLSGMIATSQPGVASYAALNGGYPSWALSAITGMSSSLYYVTPGASSSAIGNALGQGKLVCICTGSSVQNSYLVTGHCYAVVGYNPSSTMPFQVFNPWGVNSYSHTGKWGYLQANGAFLEANFLTWGFAGSAAPSPGSVNAALSADLHDRGAVAKTKELGVTAVDTSSNPGTHESVKTVAKPSAPIATLVSPTIHGRRGASLPGGPLSSKRMVAELVS